MLGFGLSTFILVTNLIVMTSYEVGTIFILILQEIEEVMPLLRGGAGISSCLPDSRAFAGVVLDTVLNGAIVTIIIININECR